MAVDSGWRVEWKALLVADIRSNNSDFIINSKKRCPLKRFKDSILNDEIFSKKMLSEINREEDKKIKISWDKALRAPFPNPKEIYSNVYSE